MANQSFLSNIIKVTKERYQRIVDGQDPDNAYDPSAIYMVIGEKSVSTSANQGLTETEKANARANIGAGTSSFDGDYNSLINKPVIGANGGNIVQRDSNGQIPIVPLPEGTDMNALKSNTTLLGSAASNGFVIQVDEKLRELIKLRDNKPMEYQFGSNANDFAPRTIVPFSPTTGYSNVPPNAGGAILTLGDSMFMVQLAIDTTGKIHSRAKFTTWGTGWSAWQ